MLAQSGFNEFQWNVLIISIEMVKSNTHTHSVNTMRFIYGLHLKSNSIYIVPCIRANRLSVYGVCILWYLWFSFRMKIECWFFNRCSFFYASFNNYCSICRLINVTSYNYLECILLRLRDTTRWFNVWNTHRFRGKMWSIKAD